MAAGIASRYKTGARLETRTVNRFSSRTVWARLAASVHINWRRGDDGGGGVVATVRTDGSFGAWPLPDGITNGRRGDDGGGGGVDD